MIIKPRQSNADFYKADIDSFGFALSVIEEEKLPNEECQCPHKGKRGGCKCP